MKELRISLLIAQHQIKSYHLLRSCHIVKAISPYRSTVHFAQFVNRHLARQPASILHVASGGGSDLVYFARQFASSNVTGMECRPANLTAARACLEDGQINSAELVDADWLAEQQHLDRRFEGLVSLYTLSECESPDYPVARMCRWAERWVAASVLAWHGDYDFIIRANPVVIGQDKLDDQRGPLYYNIYSLTTLTRLFERNGFSRFHTEPFHIDIDLQPPEMPRLGTYTRMTVEGDRLQLSGPLLMPWWFIFAERSDK